MTQYIDFGDTITIKTKDFLQRVSDVSINYYDSFAKSLSGIDTLKYTMEKNSVGMFILSEESFSEDGKSIGIEKNANHIKIGYSDIFNMLSLDMASLEKNKTTPTSVNDINTSVKLSENHSVIDGDVIQLSMDNFISILEENKAVDSGNIKRYRDLNDLGLNNVLLSFHYEDERNACVLSGHKYNKTSKPYPYNDMVVDIYLTDNDFSLFTRLDGKDDLESLKKNIEFDKEDFGLVLEDFKNNNDESFEKSKGFLERVEFHRKDSERYTRHEGNLLTIISEGSDVENKLNYIGNFRNEKNDFINIEEILNISNVIKQSKVSRPRMRR